MASSWASYQIRKIAGCACAGNAGNVFPRRLFQRKPLVSDPGMHHGTCVTHVPWCMSGSLTCGDGENVPGIPGACAPANLRIWQEAHARHHVNDCHCTAEFAIWRLDSFTVSFGGDVLNTEMRRTDKDLSTLYWTHNEVSYNSIVMQNYPWSSIKRYGASWFI